MTMVNLIVRLLARVSLSIFVDPPPNPVHASRLCNTLLDSMVSGLFSSYGFMTLQKATDRGPGPYTSSYLKGYFLTQSSRHLMELVLYRSCRYSRSARPHFVQLALCAAVMCMGYGRAKVAAGVLWAQDAAAFYFAYQLFTISWMDCTVDLDELGERMMDGQGEKVERMMEKMSKKERKDFERQMKKHKKMRRGKRN
ncbi:hypothetical protein TrRE_jg5670 [Triparma retinervis]|uniref:Uncharacterized protein n=1 Tax=Triparma retinervis TaxID=2557542 RepID=A0A9W7AV63_9STRA|nr:hypothetical protein TrRE_jg5670 [Triparma retinervis]